MTAMQQIEFISIEAGKLGMKYGEYVEKFEHTLPKPKSQEYTPIGEVRHYKKRKAIELTCQMCGQPFIAKSPLAKFCEECKQERGCQAFLKWRKKQPPKVRIAKTKKCEICGTEFTTKGRGKYCADCAREVQKKQIQENLKIRYYKQKEQRNNAEISE